MVDAPAYVSRIVDRPDIHLHTQRVGALNPIRVFTECINVIINSVGTCRVDLFGCEISGKIIDVGIFRSVFDVRRL